MTKDEWYALLRWESAGSKDPMLREIAIALNEVASEYRATDAKRDALLARIVEKYGDPLVEKVKQNLEKP